MRWLVEGADAQTGRDVRIVIEAVSAAEAEQKAMDRRVLVSRVTVAPAAAPTPQQSEETDRLVKQRLDPTPEYDEIVSGASALGVLASLVAGVGWLFVLGGFVFIVIAIGETVNPQVSPVHGVSVVTLVVGGAVALGYGVMILLAASLVRMIGSMGLALRDLARNSFRR